MIEEYEVVTVKFSEQEGCITDSDGDTLTFNNHSPLRITVPYASGDATLGSFLRASFADNVTSKAPQFLLALHNHMQAFHPGQQ